ncbi:hypothetical protein [Burkholderia sp. BCC1999]|uniref:hypothetical protein n=1 Tax=Burkholderia sp. BCC1999 TaxID=2817448 RepID=UPI002AC336B9|nr:hypothetical protein [Burkholderia sp. BCC1999]
METFCGQAAWREMMFFVGVDEKKAGAQASGIGDGGIAAPLIARPRRSTITPGNGTTSA